MILTDRVTLSDGHGSGERARTRRSARSWTYELTEAVPCRSGCLVHRGMAPGAVGADGGAEFRGLRWQDGSEAGYWEAGFNVGLFDVGRRVLSHQSRVSFQQVISAAWLRRCPSRSVRFASPEPGWAG